MIELNIVEQLLGVPPGYERWRVAAIAQKAKITVSWLSSLEARGEQLSGDAQNFLDRARRRVNVLHAVGEDLKTRFPITVIKGAEIARRMPAGLQRNSGDSDIVAPDEQTLWQVIDYLRESRGALAQSVSLLRTATSTDLVVAMKWAAEEPFLDKPLGADISTCAFSGNMKDVPVRAKTPQDPDICSLFAVSEERFQRKFSVKDMLDFVVLADVIESRGLADTVLIEAEKLALAPELLSLLLKTSDWVPLSDTWQELADRLPPIADAERAQRKAGTRPIPQLGFGYPLDERRSAEPRATVHQFDGAEIMSTPIGTCLLVPGTTIDQDLLDAAQRAAKSL
jgi:hypothetical protein